MTRGDKVTVKLWGKGGEAHGTFAFSTKRGIWVRLTNQYTEKGELAHQDRPSLVMFNAEDVWKAK